MEKHTNTESKPVLCRNSCGFYGNPNTYGLCSRCYRSYLKKQQQKLNEERATAAKASAMEKPNTAEENSVVAGDDQPIDLTIKKSGGDVEQSGAERVIKMDADVSPALVPPPPPEPQVPVADGVLGALDALDALGDLDAQRHDLVGKECTKKKKNRCAECNRKVGLTGFQCRCGGLYCPLHRYSDKHNCSFNYREMGAQEIRKNNPVVIGKKVNKI